MACNCDNYIDCGDPDVEGGSTSGQEGYTHTYSNEALISNMPFLFTSRVKRTFTVNSGWDRTVTLGYIVTGCEQPVSCDNASKATPFCTQSEDCSMELNIPYYIDRQRDIFVWKNVKETLLWKLSSNGKTVPFKEKWGTGYHHKICIPNTVKTQGTETFYMSKDGIESVLAKQEYEYNPFPVTESGGATWGLYGNTVTRTAVPDTLNVACILLFPNVPKQAIPYDNDVIAYGFYDYNVMEGGFVESSLPKDDGGKDYFYPYWCRQMPFDSLWRSTADSRYTAVYDQKLDLSGTYSWIPDSPTTYALPFGSFAIDSEDNFVYSMLLQFSDRCNKKGLIINHASFGDLYKAIYEDNGITAGEFNDFYPVSLI